MKNYLRSLHARYPLPTQHPTLLRSFCTCGALKTNVLVEDGAAADPPVITMTGGQKEKLRAAVGALGALGALGAGTVLLGVGAVRMGASAGTGEAGFCFLGEEEGVSSSSSEGGAGRLVLLLFRSGERRAAAAGAGVL